MTRQDRDVEPMAIDEAVHRALHKLNDNEVTSHWTDAGYMPSMESFLEGDPNWAGGTTFKDKRDIEIHGDTDNVWKVIEGIGGKRGWYHANWLLYRLEYQQRS